MHLVKKIGVGLGAAILAVALSASSCDGSSPKQNAGNQENASRLNTYQQLVANQPVHTMSYSPTRATKNFWIDTWNKPGKLSYVYLQSSTGSLLGYYVFVGLPVSYCTGIIPPVQKVRVDLGSDYGDTYIPAPSVDGTYSSGGNCNTYYGKDAVSGAYVEYTAGLGINVLLYDQPMPRAANVQPLGQATIETAQKKAGSNGK